jgi:hypothetical protein
MGCKGSKNVDQPKAIGGTNPAAIGVSATNKEDVSPLKKSQTPNKSLTSPSKSPSKGLKPIAEAQL